MPVIGSDCEPLGAGERKHCGCLPDAFCPRCKPSLRERGMSGTPAALQAENERLKAKIRELEERLVRAEPVTQTYQPRLL